MVIRERLTDDIIRALKPDGYRRGGKWIPKPDDGAYYEFKDYGERCRPYLFVRVSASGYIAYRFTRRLKKKHGFVRVQPTIGDARKLTLEQARTIHDQWEAWTDAGEKDPLGREQRELDQAIAAKPSLDEHFKVRIVLPRYIAEGCIGQDPNNPIKRSYTDIDRDLTRLLIPECGERRIDTIQLVDGQRIYNRIKNPSIENDPFRPPGVLWQFPGKGRSKGAGAPMMANSFAGELKGFSDWCLVTSAFHPGPVEPNDPNDRALTTIPFGWGIKKSPYKANERVFTHDELRAIHFIAIHWLAFPEGPGMLLLEILGQREGEIGFLEHKELRQMNRPDGAQIVLPFKRQKARNTRKDKSDHIIDLPEPPWRIIDSCVRQHGVFDGVHVFSGRSPHTKKKRRGITKWDTVKDRIDRLMAYLLCPSDDPKEREAWAKSYSDKSSRRYWTWHTFRHTWRTLAVHDRFKELADQKMLAEMCLNHREKFHYEHNVHGPGMRAMFNIFCQRLLLIVSTDIGSGDARLPNTTLEQERNRVLISETDYDAQEKISMLKNMRALPNWDKLIPQNIKWPIYTAAICRNPECSRMGEPYLPENSTSAMYLVYCSQECQIEYDPKRRAANLKPRVCANPDCINGGGKGGVTYQPQRLNSRHCEHACYLDWYYRNVTKPKNGPLLCEQVKKVTPNFGKRQVKKVTAKFSKHRVKKINHQPR